MRDRLRAHELLQAATARFEAAAEGCAEGEEGGCLREWRRGALAWAAFEAAFAAHPSYDNGRALRRLSDAMEIFGGVLLYVYVYVRMYAHVYVHAYVHAYVHVCYIYTMLSVLSA